MRLLKLLLPLFVAISLILLDARFTYLKNFRSSLSTLLAPIYFVVDLPSHVIDWVNDKGSEKAILISENEQLKNEMIELKVKLQTYNNLVLEKQKINLLLNSSYTLPNYKAKLAQIKSISQTRLKKQIVINKGSSDGIRKLQVALSSDGVVGQVVQTNPFYSTVRLVNDPTLHIPVKSLKNGSRGVTKGVATTNGGMIIEFLPIDANISIGDIFVTSGIGSIYPSGYPVGKVIEFEKYANTEFLSIKLEPIADMSQVEYILIISKE
jgi:rod shape-determining protein MreC